MQEHPTDLELQQVFEGNSTEEMKEHVQNCSVCQRRIRNLPTLSMRENPHAQDKKSSSDE